MPTVNRGIYGKFIVNRVDGRDSPGGDKTNAKYFVLDYANDQYAKKALAHYALCLNGVAEYKQLQRDILFELGILNIKAVEVGGNIWLYKTEEVLKALLSGLDIKWNPNYINVEDKHIFYYTSYVSIYDSTCVQYVEEDV